MWGVRVVRLCAWGCKGGTPVGGSSLTPCAGVGIGVPGLLLHPECCLGQDGAEPAGDVHANVVNLVGVLSDSPWAVLIRLVLQDLHSAALATGLIPTLFLFRSQYSYGLGEEA